MSAADAQPDAMRAYYARGKEPERLAGGMRLRGYREIPDFERCVLDSERSGWLPPVSVDGFTATTHRPGDLAGEIAEAGLVMTELLGVEDPAGFFPDIAERMCDDADRRAVLEAARALEAIPEVIGASPHLLAVAARPGAAADQP